MFNQSNYSSKMKNLFLVLIALIVGVSAHAQTPQSKEALKGEVSAPLSSLRLANNLVCYGYAQQSALPLIQALEIISEIPTQALRGEKEKQEEKTGEAKEEKVSFDYNKILADAKKFADGNEHFLALISSIEASKAGSNRGAVNGPSRTVEVVYGNSNDNYQISFVEGRLAEILVSGDGDTDLDLYVYDSKGNLIEKDADYTDDCYVSWIPAWTGRFTVKVVNRGPVPNRYVLLTN